MIWITLLVVFLGLVYWFVLKRYKYWERKGVTQNQSVVPFFGDNFSNLFGGIVFYDVVMNIYNRFPNVRYTGLYQMTQPLLMLRDPELIKQMCVKDFEHFLDHQPFAPEEADPLWNRNVFALRGQKWKDMRATLSPSFTGSKMRQMLVLMQECAKNFVVYFSQDQNDIQEIELKDTFTRYTNDIIATTAFGIHCDSLKDRDNEFFVNGREATDFSGLWKNIKFMLILLMPWLGKMMKGILFSVELSNFFRRIVKETLDYREKHHIERPDMINLLMHARKGTQREDEVKTEEHQFSAVNEQLELKHEPKGKLDLTLDDITSQAMIFFFAGFETVSTAMCFMAYELAINPDIQKKLIEELDEFREKNRKLTYEGLAKLSYLDMVFTETLRKWPPVIATDRSCVKPYVIKPELPEEKPVHLNIGDTLWIPIWALHHDPKYWSNPEKFDPERFSHENKDKIVPNTYYPFGVGPRNCIGSRFAILEVKMIFYEILSRFEIIPIEKSTIPFVQKVRSFNLSAENGFWFGFKKRIPSVERPMRID